MTQKEREYFEHLKEMNIDAEMRKALYINQITEDENGDPLEHPIVDLAQYTESFDVIAKNLESKIAESKTKIFMNFINIRNLIDNVEEFDKDKDNIEEEDEKNKYNAVISKSLDDITNLFEMCEDESYMLLLYLQSYEIAKEGYKNCKKTYKEHLESLDKNNDSNDEDEVDN